MPGPVLRQDLAMKDGSDGPVFTDEPHSVD
jgi:hypothetical protein